MTIKSTPDRYGSVALALHWTSAALIMALVPIGFAMQSAPEAMRLGLYGAHAVIGLLVGSLTLARLVWWRAFDRRPEALPEHPALQRRLAKAVHLVLYGAVLILTASGIGLMAISGFGAALASGDPSLMPADLMRYPPRVVHGAVARLLMGLLILHVAGALYHTWIRRDGTLRRMLPAGR